MADRLIPEEDLVAAVNHVLVRGRPMNSFHCLKTLTLRHFVVLLHSAQSSRSSCDRRLESTSRCCPLKRMSAVQSLQRGRAERHQPGKAGVFYMRQRQLIILI